MILVRTLNTVGGYRARLVPSTRKVDRFARRLGFRDWKAYVAYLANNKAAMARLQHIGENVRTHVNAAA